MLIVNPTEELLLEALAYRLARALQWGQCSEAGWPSATSARWS
jgi:hypothetical protein